ncbi:hypothetical protein D3C72_1134870 [compost metagenome]
MHTKNTFHVLAVSARLATEATCISDITQRQLRFVKDLISVHTSKYMFCASLQPQIVTLELVAIVTWLKTIHCVVKFSTNHKWWQNWDERLYGHVELSLVGNSLQSILICHCIKHELNNAELQLHKITLDIRKATTCYFCGTLFVDPVTLRSNFSMVTRSKTKFSLIAHDLRKNILIFSRSNWHITSRHIRHKLVKRRKGLVSLFEVGLDCHEGFLNSFTLFDKFRCRTTTLHLRRDKIPFFTQLICLLLQVALYAVPTEQLININFVTFIACVFLHSLGIVADKTDI